MNSFIRVWRKLVLLIAAKFPLWSSYLRMLDGRFTARIHHLVNLHFAFNKIFGKFLNNRSPWEMWPLFWFPVWSCLTADLLKNASDRIDMVFNKSEVTWAVALTSGRVWYTGLLRKVTSYEIAGWVFSIISSFLWNRWPRVVLEKKHLQEYPVIAGVLQCSIHGPKLFLPYINDFPDDLICNIAIHADDNILYFWTWIWPTRYYGLGQEVTCFFDWSYNYSVIYLNIDRSVIEEKSSFRML